MSKNSFNSRCLIFAIALCSFAFATVMSKNVSAYTVSGAYMSWAATGTYNSCTTRYGSKTTFGMSFMIDGQWADVQECCCVTPSHGNFMTSSGGVFPFSNYWSGYAGVSDQGSRLFVTFTPISGYDLQTVGCYVSKPVVDTYDYGYEYDTSYYNDIATTVININASSSVSGISGVSENLGWVNTYTAKDNNVTVNFNHQLLQNPNSGFDALVSYKSNSASYYDKTINVPSGNNAIANGSKTSSVSLSINDGIEKICQGIDYTSRTWRYDTVQPMKKVKEYYYEYHYRNGSYVGKRAISVTENNYYNGSSYKQNFRGDGDSGSSQEACASVYRPWNYVASFKDWDTTEGVAYVGDPFKIGGVSFGLNVTKNDVNYKITDIPNATITLCKGLEGQESCDDVIYSNVRIGSSTIKNDSNYSFYNSDNYSATGNIPEKYITITEDIPAGSKYCVRLKMNYSNSGNGKYSDRNGEIMTDNKCYVVKKRPTVQVWGGNVVSGGMIQSSITKKAFGTFGSWGELAVVAGGKIDGFASGASLAKGGEVEGVFSKFATLTLANTITSDIQLGGNFNVSNDKTLKDRNTIIEKIKAAEYVSELPDSPVTGRVYIYKEGDLYIGKNIEYLEENTSLTDMPKVLIYATRNIYIDCNVARIDAIMVAGGTVNTCASSDGSSPDIDAHARSNQLVINGMIIAEKLVLNRTYGAGVGIEASDVPAEIINYDPLIEVMFSDKIDSNDLTGLNVVYTQEQVVRY